MKQNDDRVGIPRHLRDFHAIQCSKAQTRFESETTKPSENSDSFS